LSVAATKTYTASLLAVAMLAVAMGDEATRSDALRALEQVPDALSVAITGTSGVAAAASLLDAGDRAVTVGRGLNLSTAYETALKVTELTGVLVAPYSPADLLHGPVAAVGAEVPAVLIAPEEPASSSVLEIVAELRRRGAPVVVVRTSGVEPLGDGVSELGLPPEARLEDWLTPLVAVVPGQLVAHALAELRGVDVDRPGGLSKVTLTK
ncbi:MAG: SIS domain-containing protein, partial [Nocardioidaceae bacterium]|nr:SIS domain-containing protein [Nocardioidaceae bacterium]